MSSSASTHTLKRCIDTNKTVCLSAFIKVNCRSEGVDLGYKSMVWAQVKAMKRN